ncbi:MAG: NADH-quinone oxidoreductase subunit H [Fimbriimonas sp.]|nr:NADH-quinone oxidoreductase subunit H [Fimbriimonas sp.]
MSNVLIGVALHCLLVASLPILLACVIRKTKARMQGRPGPPFLQPALDLAKRLKKSDTVSETTSWVFRANPLVGVALTVWLALVLPWTGATPILRGSGVADLILIVYLLAAIRFFAILAALDTGSAFGGLGASREAALSVLIEPGLVIGLAAASLSSRTLDLSIGLGSPVRPTVAILSAAAFLIAALSELSRMPIDDTTTHLELTMVHEATILEYSGRRLALIEWTVMIRTAMFFGIAAVLLVNGMFGPDAATNPLIIGTGVIAAGLFLAVFEGVSVKLNWRRVPSFVAFSTALAVMSAFVAAVER